MKKIILFLSIIGLLFSCKNDPKTTNKTEVTTTETPIEKITSKLENINVEAFKACEEADCPILEVSYLTITGAHAETINKVNQQQLITIFNSAEENAPQHASLKDAIGSFIDDYINFKHEFPDSHAEYEANISQEVRAETAQTLLLQTNYYLFTGGAHGYGATRYTNFDKKTGKALSTKDLIKNLDAFTAYAEKEFRKKYKLSKEENINAKGFLFEDNKFALPTNIGITNNKVLLVYNRYEAASYADGELTITLDKETVKNWLNY
ncbi:hypothetical protein GGR32_000671 [Mesonia hippocampi]|uniref:DUF3298/DUF4163 domain-containing protein n=1 Tax=Mesonia hippocampi TaxID=1628250 RepID=A0A840EU24_9FLAO|nr:DUF3298 and DUF4163 domain-containing protein [Mesonia hippocampi]MBB4118397.1 hypothetical protein [Mesonia hippocampi]